MSTNLQQRFEDRFEGNIHGVFRDGKIIHPEYKPLIKENVLALIKAELESLAEEVFELHGTSEQAAAVIRNRANEISG